MPGLADVLVVGGGVIGGAAAWALAERGVSVTLLEAGRVGRGATWASAGNPTALPRRHQPSTPSLNPENPFKRRHNILPPMPNHLERVKGIEPSS